MRCSLTETEEVTAGYPRIITFTSQQNLFLRSGSLARGVEIFTLGAELYLDNFPIPVALLNNRHIFL